MNQESWSSLPGWFDFQSLYSQIVKEAENGDILVEIGVFQGKSAIFMADLIRESKKDLKFFAIDPWIMMKDEKDQPYGCYLEDFEANIIACDVFGFVSPLKGFSVEAARMFKDQSVKFVFIDGEHSYDSVRNDIRAWLPKLSRNGILAGHDYNRCWPGVKRAVDERFPDKVIEGDSWIWRRPL